MEQSEQPEPSTPKRKQLTRDQIVQTRLLRSLGWSYMAISSHLNITQAQVQYSVFRESPTPKKRSGRPSKLSEDQTRELIQYVRSSPKARQQSYASLKDHFSHWKVSEYTIRTALRKHGLTRGISRPKAPTNEVNNTKQTA